MYLTNHCAIEKAVTGIPSGHQQRGGGVLLPGGVCTKTKRPVADFLREKHPDMRAPPVENRTCPSSEEYEEVLEAVSLEFL